MNIFYLHEDPQTCAQMHHDKHVVKMILETAQLLSTAHRVIDGEMYEDKTNNGRKIKRWRLEDVEKENTLYKATHINHPSNVWARETEANYNWLYKLFIHLGLEYTYRYGKVHESIRKLSVKLSQPPKNIKQAAMTKMPQAMPDEYKNESSIEAYRTYYINEKKNQSKYTNRGIPTWLI